MFPDLNHAGAGTDPAAATATPQWFKVGEALSYTTFSAAATTKTNTLFTLPAGGVIHETKVKHSLAFTGGAVASCTISVGITGTLEKYASAFNVFQAAGATVMQVSDSLGTESHTATTAIKITADSTGANLNALTAGVVDVWALISVPV